MKWIGVILLLAAGGGSGAFMTVKLSRRVTILEQFYRFLCRLSGRIRSTGEPLPELFSKMSRMKEFEDFSLLHRAVNDPVEEDIRLSWKRAVCAGTPEWDLLPPDRELLAAFAEGLGTADIAEEEAYCLRYAQTVKERLQAAKKEQEKKSRAYICVGVCAGVLLSLLLL